MKKTLPISIVVVLIVAAGVWWFFGARPGVSITTFEECTVAGNPVMESYPRQCRAGGQTFTESVGNELEKTDLIRINTPRPNQTISSPLTITGEARGNWYFEASFPIVLTDWDGKIIAKGIARAKSDWMTTDFVPFEATLTFTVDKNAYRNKGSLILRKDNPSGLPQNDDALEIPIMIAGITETAKSPPTACTQEAKLCQDGSAVGRTGPNCEFARCPATSTSTASNIQPLNAPGSVSLQPGGIAEIRNESFYFSLQSLSLSSAMIQIAPVGCWNAFPSDPPPQIRCMIAVVPIPQQTLSVGQTYRAANYAVTLTHISNSTATFSVSAFSVVQ